MTERGEDDEARPVIGWYCCERLRRGNFCPACGGGRVDVGRVERSGLRAIGKFRTWAAQCRSNEETERGKFVSEVGERLRRADAFGRRARDLEQVAEDLETMMEFYKNESSCDAK